VMRLAVDSGLIAFCGSETRVSTLGVLANSNRPLTGYRVSKISGLQPIKVYRELARAVESGLVARSVRGYRLIDPDIRTLLQKRIRVYWSEAWLAGESDRAQRAAKRSILSIAPFDSSRYKPNPTVASRYRREFDRPREKDQPSSQQGVNTSRKRK